MMTLPYAAEVPKYLYLFVIWDIYIFHKCLIVICWRGSYLGCTQTRLQTQQILETWPESKFSP